jgi:hypothetical protein
MRIGMSWEFLLMGGVSRWWLFSFLVELDLSLMVEFIDQAKAIFGVTTGHLKALGAIIQQIFEKRRFLYTGFYTFDCSKKAQKQYKSLKLLQPAYTTYQIFYSTYCPPPFIKSYTVQKFINKSAF